MKNTRAPWWLLLILFPLSCNKHATLPTTDHTPFRSEAVSALWSVYPPDTTTYTWSARYSQPTWDNARAQARSIGPAATPWPPPYSHPPWNNARAPALSIGPAVTVPIATRPGLTLHAGAPALPANQITWALLYRDTLRQWRIERVTRIPFSPTNYELRIEDWQGNFLRAYLYTPSATINLTESHTYIRTNL